MKRIGIALFFCLMSACTLAQDVTPPQDRVDAVLDVVEKNYTMPTGRGVLEERMLRTFLRDLDPYSSYMNAEEWAGFESSFSGEFVGIGVTLKIDNETRLPEIEYLLHGSRAAEAGLQRRDRIVSIDGRATEGLPMEDVVGSLRGLKGSDVEMKIRRANASALLPFRIKRGSVKTPNVRGFRRNANGEPDFVMDAERGIGYIRILLFGDDTVATVQRAMAEMKQRKMKGFVLDLRGCVGGKMHAAVKTADLFLDHGRILSIATRNETEVFDAKPGVSTKLPVVMLINADTTSSAEIFAGALVDNKRVIAIGQQTYGKGRIQEKFALPSGQGGVVVSTGTFQRPSGKTFDRHDMKEGQKAGIAPDEGMQIILKQEEREAWIAEMERLDGPYVLEPEEQMSKVPDPVLSRGLEVLEGLIR